MKEKTQERSFIKKLHKEYCLVFEHINQEN